MFEKSGARILNPFSEKVTITLVLDIANQSLEMKNSAPVPIPMALQALMSASMQLIAQWAAQDSMIVKPAGDTEPEAKAGNDGENKDSNDGNEGN
jgi:hypothetical protein